MGLAAEAANPTTSQRLHRGRACGCTGRCARVRGACRGQATACYDTREELEARLHVGTVERAAIRCFVAVGLTVPVVRQLIGALFFDGVCRRRACSGRGHVC